MAEKKRVEIIAEARHVAAWRKLAAAAGLDLSGWIRSTLIAAAKAKKES